MLGAGDAFSAGFLSGWLRGEDYDACCRYANACGALVVSRHGCAPAMPTRIELDHFIANAAPHPATRQGRRADASSSRDGAAGIAAGALRLRFRSSRPFLRDGARDGCRRAPPAGAEASLRARRSRRPEPRAVSRAAIGLLCDDRYGQDALNAATGRGWWIGRPVEWPGSNPVVFEHGRSIGTTLVSWPVEHVVKCLVPLHPDDDVVNRFENEAQVRALYDAVQASGHELLIEIVPPRHLPQGSGCLPARGEAALQSRHLSGVVEAAAVGQDRLARARRIDRGT